MKKLLLLSTLSLFVFSVFIYSCKKEGFKENEISRLMSSEGELSPEEIIQKTDSIGFWHNRCLEHVSSYFDSLKSQGWEGTLEEVTFKIEYRTLTYLKEHGVIPSDFYFNHDEDISLDVISLSAQGMITSIDNSINDYFSGIKTKSEFRNSLFEIQSLAANELNTEEAIVVASGANVALNSFNFWSSEAMEYSIYENIFYENSGQPMTPFITENQKEV